MLIEWIEGVFVNREGLEGMVGVRGGILLGREEAKARGRIASLPTPITLVGGGT